MEESGVNNQLTLQLLLCLLGSALLLCHPAIRRAGSKISLTRLTRFFWFSLVAAFIAIGWTKGPVQPKRRAMAQYVIALFTGGIRDASGLVAATTEAETVAAFADYARAIANSASQTVAAASFQFDDLADVITNDATPTVYLQCYLPRADHAAGITNHNLSATLMRTRQSADASVISRWIYFSNTPLFAPKTYAEIDVGAGYVRLASITNTFPETELVLNLPCYRYDYAVPADMRGVVFFPDFDLGFGSVEKGLEISSEGVMVDIADQTYIGKSGSVWLCSNRVQVVHAGGIAVELRIDGQTMTNGVYEL